ncbi:hypothetical protein J3R82DRAFT_7889 [Butyriboletus roseoflavus]|nr:hypothetical protein J3R82DRAFT_7889 [Butyriboletus roseoflavus]
MDDDVQYLGTKLAAPEPLDDPCEAHRSVTGMSSLSICLEDPAHIPHPQESPCTLKNAVVSARHAKLVLSDSGQVYIVDLHSRHGTHLLRRGEATARMLQAEVETLLADGDVLTFGKVVGAGSYHVSPVTVRVELLSGRSSFEPSADYALTILNPPSPVSSRPRKLSSGRYGLISACCMESDSPQSSSSISVSSDAVSSASEQESDVEDEHFCVPALLRDGQGMSSVKIPAFRSFIREIYHNTASHSPVIPDVPDVPLEDAPGTPSTAAAVSHLSPVIVPKSRSHSPMQVAMTPSPPPETQQSEPAVIGAWPVSRPESPRHSSLEMETGRSEAPPAPELDRQPEPIPAQPSSQTRVIPDALIELMHRLPPPPPFFPIGGPFSNSIASDFGLPSVPHPPPPPPPPHRMPPFHPLHKVVTECVSSEIKGSLKSTEDRITTLQESISELKSRQSVTEEDVVDLQSHCEMLEPESERLLCRITAAERNIASLSTLQSQMTVLQNQVTTFRERLDAPEPKPVETPMDDVRACADALNNLVSEMRLLHEDVEKRIEAKMEVIQSARTEALDALKEVAVEAKVVFRLDIFSRLIII